MSNRLVLIAAVALAGCSSATRSALTPVVRSFTATPASVGPDGEVQLAWDVSSDAVTLFIDQGVGTVTGTAIAVHPAQTTTYTLTATNSVGATGAATVTATVSTSALPAPAIAQFSASPASIATGGVSALSWSVANATTISINPGPGLVSGSTLAVSPDQTTTYTLTATGPGGARTATAKVTVLPLPALTFSASPETIAAGQSSTLSWTATSATSLVIDHGIGAVTGTTSIAVSPTVTTEYLLTATGPGGIATSFATVTVTGTTPVPPAISSFTASPTTVSAGAASTLQWSVSNATSLSLDNGIGAVTGTSKTVNPAATTTYTLTAMGAGPNAVATATVTVAATPGPVLVYTDPAVGTGKLRLVRNASSTDRHLVLDFKVGNGSLSLFGVALTLPLNASLVSFASSTATSLGGLSVSGPIDPGAAPAAAAARMMTSGPLAGKLVIGLARKKVAAADGDISCAPGTTLFSIALDGAGTGTGTVFDGAAPGLGFRGRALSKSGLLVASEAEVAVGLLQAQQLR